MSQKVDLLACEQAKLKLGVRCSCAEGVERESKYEDVEGEGVGGWERSQLALQGQLKMSSFLRKS